MSDGLCRDIVADEPLYPSLFQMKESINEHISELQRRLPLPGRSQSQNESIRRGERSGSMLYLSRYPHPRDKGACLPKISSPHNS